jgi:hypothetical protein
MAGFGGTPPAQAVGGFGWSCPKPDRPPASGDIRAGWKTGLPGVCAIKIPLTKRRRAAGAIIFGSGA